MLAKETRKINKHWQKNIPCYSASRNAQETPKDLCALLSLDNANKLIFDKSLIVGFKNNKTERPPIFLFATNSRYKRGILLRILNLSYIL